MSAPAGLDAATVKHPDAMAPLLDLLDELGALTRSAGREDLSGQLGMVRARVADPRARVLLLGPTKNGMSTLVNALVGAPVSATETAVSVPVIVEYATEPSATLVRAVGNGRVERQRVDPLDPGPALRAQGVVRAEFTQPSALLAEGLVMLDSPGLTPEHAADWSMVAAADAVCWVTGAATALSAAEVDQLRRIQQVCPAVICIVNKIDRNPDWEAIVARNREILDKTGLGFAVAPVSAGRYRQAQLKRDATAEMESGVPQLIDHLRESVLDRADSLAKAAAAREIRLLADQVLSTLHAEAESLRDPRARAQALHRVALAREESERVRSRTANWQVALADGAAELAADVEHDLRHRLRSLVRDAEAEIGRTDPGRRWHRFENELSEQVSAALVENFEIAAERAQELAYQVAEKLPADNRQPPLPELRLRDPREILDQVAPLDRLERRGGSIQQVVSILRGSYGGILMVGLVTSLLGMSLVNWYSAGAGLLLGINAWFDERRVRKQRRQAEARLAVSRYVDEVSFHVGKESRNRLRLAQRALRDHFTTMTTEALRSADTALQDAEAASAPFGEQGRHRLSSLDADSARLRQLVRRAQELARPPVSVSGG